MRALDEQARLLVDVADEVGRVGVAVHAVDVGRDVDVDDVAVLERAGVGDAVADDLVDARAHRLREALVAEGRGVGAVVEHVLVGDGVELVGGDAGRDAPSTASTMAVAAMRDAMRIFSMVSASLMRTSPSSRGLGTST